MDSLPEELLDHIVSFFDAPVGRFLSRPMGELYALSLTSRKLRRIAEPHLYRSIALGVRGQTACLSRNFSVWPHLIRSVKSVSIEPRYLKLRCNVSEMARSLGLTSRLTHLRTLQLITTYGTYKTYRITPGELIPVLRLPSLTTLIVHDVMFSLPTESTELDWAFTNTSVKTLDLIVYYSDSPEFHRFAAVFCALETLIIDNRSSCDAFHRIVLAFHKSFAQSLRSFTYRELPGPFEAWEHSPWRRISHNKQVGMERAHWILVQSQLTHLQTHMYCLLRAASRADNLMQYIPPSFPPTLQVLDLDHYLMAGFSMNRIVVGGGRLVLAPFGIRCLDYAFQTLIHRDQLPALKAANIEVLICTLSDRPESVPALDLSVLEQILDCIKERGKDVEIDLDLIVIEDIVGYTNSDDDSNDELSVQWSNHES